MACFGPPPPPYFAMPGPAPAPGLMGKTIYHYVTRDGGPPNKGAPPKAPAAPAPPAFAMWPGPPPAPKPTPFIIPPGPGFPGAVCVPNASAPAQPAAPFPAWFNAPGPAAPTAGFLPLPAPATAGAGNRQPPVSGNRVKDNLLVVKNSGGLGHVVSKYNATFHLFDNNVIEKHLDRRSNTRQFYIPAHASESFRVMTVACSMPIEELIEQLDCIKIAPAGSVRSDIGIAEVFEVGDGWFEIGSRFFLDEQMSKMTIKEAWGPSIGEANLSRPRYLVRIAGRDHYGQ